MKEKFTWFEIGLDVDVPPAPVLSVKFSLSTRQLGHTTIVVDEPIDRAVQVNVEALFEETGYLESMDSASSVDIVFVLWSTYNNTNLSPPLKPTDVFYFETNVELILEFSPLGHHTTRSASTSQPDDSSASTTQPDDSSSSTSQP